MIIVNYKMITMYKDLGTFTQSDTLSAIFKDEESYRNWLEVTHTTTSFPMITLLQRRNK